MFDVPLHKKRAEYYRFPPCSQELVSCNRGEAKNEGIHIWELETQSPGWRLRVLTMLEKVHLGH